jgi:hypothetical protein
MVAPVRQESVMKAKTSSAYKSDATRRIVPTPEAMRYYLGLDMWKKNAR